MRELVAVAFACVGLDPDRYVEVDPALMREREPTAAIGDPTRARERLAWTAQTSFEDLVAEELRTKLRGSINAIGSGQSAPPSYN